MRTKLLIIDPQNDFVSPSGSLCVPGADGDMDRLAALIDRIGAEIEAIHVTLDTHQRLDISHPLWWQDASGASPAPFTSFTAADVRAGTWRTRDPQAHARSLAYLEGLEASQRYPHVVWPEHCLTGTHGHAVWPALHAAIGRWEGEHLARAHYVWKGKNPWTEHFSAIRAEVIDPDDPHTQPDEAWIADLRDCDRLLVAGEALSHCVANTVRDLVDAWGGEADRLVLLGDTASNVPGFDGYGTAFVEELCARGMTLGSSDAA
ncbi:MAG: isochorismatase family protein [Deltaproteobacteria bacterium]|nr:MAG: isochorismatase family protein [Deltaproteobacteria bacterium]